MTSVSILGGGAWGTALAFTCYKAGNITTLWIRDPQQAEKMLLSRENEKYLAGHVLPSGITITHSIEKAIESHILLLVCPAQNLRSFLESIKNIIPKDAYLVICSKGIELETSKLLSEVIAEILPGYCIGVLSGPTFAQDMAEGQPTAATLATKEITTARWLASSLSCPTFRLYPSSDVIGVELGGALKNVIAIAAGISSARNLGESARASLMTRGLSEIAHLGLAMGAQLETFMGLSGVGDIVLSCTSPQSRNMSFGLKIGRLDRFIPNDQNMSILTEGVFTAKAVQNLSVSRDVELPIAKSIYRIIHQGSPIYEEIKLLLSRPLKTEPFGV